VVFGLTRVRHANTYGTHTPNPGRLSIKFIFRIDDMKTITLIILTALLSGCGTTLYEKSVTVNKDADGKTVATQETHKIISTSRNRVGALNFLGSEPETIQATKPPRQGR
jgi:hypothetical protein